MMLILAWCVGASVALHFHVLGTYALVSVGVYLAAHALDVSEEDERDC